MTGLICHGGWAPIEDRLGQADAANTERTRLSERVVKLEQWRWWVQGAAAAAGGVVTVGLALLKAVAR